MELIYARMRYCAIAEMMYLTDVHVQFMRHRHEDAWKKERCFQSTRLPLFHLVRRVVRKIERKLDRVR